MNIMDVKKNLFKNVISDYEFGRPKYPEELYEEIRRFSGIGPTSEILEVGAGTGQATDLFASHGHKVDLLEISDEQVAYLKEKYKNCPNIAIYKDYFEEFTTKKEYDLIYSATAFHWIKCENGYPKAWRMLRTGGTMAVFWNIFLDMDHSGGVFDELKALKKNYMPQERDGLTLAEIKEKRINQITVGDFFDLPEYHEYRTQERYDVQRFLAYLKTYSGTLMLDDSTRSQYLQAVSDCLGHHGGSIEVPEIVSLYLMRKEGEAH